MITFHGPRVNPAVVTSQDLNEAIIFIVAMILSTRDPEDPRLTLLYYAPSGTPFDVKTFAAIANSFADYFPVRLFMALNSLQCIYL